MKRCLAFAAMVMLAATAPAWAQRGRAGGGRSSGGTRSFGVARASPRGFARAATPTRSSFGRFSSASRFRTYNGYRHGYYRNRGYVPFWWGGTLCYLDTLAPYDYSCGGYPLGAYGYYGDYESYGEAQPAESYAEQPPYSYAPQQAPIVIQLPPAGPSPQPSVSERQAPAQPETQPFVLMRRDGRVIEAVAFTIAGGQVTYITPEGLRRSFPVGELDKDATREWNDAKGTSVTLPG